MSPERSHRRILGEMDHREPWTGKAAGHLRLAEALRDRVDTSSITVGELEPRPGS